MRHQYRIAISLYLYSVCCVAGAPTAGDLLFACDYAGQHGFRNQYGMMCIWYARPCDCHISKDEDMPRVCPPTGVSDDDLIRQVREGIRNNPGLMPVGAGMAAATILAPLYPCNASDELRNN